MSSDQSDGQSTSEKPPTQPYLKRRMKKLGDVLVNLAGWISIPCGLFILFAVAKSFQSACQLSVGVTVVKFVDYKLFLAQIVGATVMLGVLALIRPHTSVRDWQSIQRRAVIEFFAIFMNVGSLFLVSAVIFFYTSLEESDKTAAGIEQQVAWVNGIMGLGALVGCWLLAPVDVDDRAGGGGG